MGGPAPAAVSDDLLAVAREAADQAAALLLERFEAGGERAVDAKSTPTDLVSAADLAAEEAIRSVLGARRPQDGLLGEEGGGAVEPPGPGERRWVFDPLDGTINFLFRIPQWCVSVACEDEHGMVTGVIVDPTRTEVFAAVRGAGATLNGEPLQPRPAATLAESLVATGFAYDAEVRVRQAEVVGRVLPAARDVRRLGSAALDLAWLAAGRYDAYYERTVKPWDVAAGSLICREAGLTVRDLPALDGLPYGIAAGRDDLLDELVALGL